MDAARFVRHVVATTFGALVLVGCTGPVVEDAHPLATAELGQPAQNPPGAFGTNTPGNNVTEPGPATPAPTNPNPGGATQVGTGSGTGGGISGAAGLGATGTGGGNATGGSTGGTGLPTGTDVPTSGGGVPGGAGLGSTGTGQTVPSPFDAGGPTVIIVN